MADKDIQIGITTTGGDQSAAEIQKVTGAQRELEKSLGIVIQTEEDLAAKRAQFMSAAEAEVAEVERMVQATQKLKAALPAVPFSQTGNVIEDMTRGPLKNGTNSVKNLGMTFTQVGYQVTDFTTQVSMGTSAFTAFAQQAPQAVAAFTQFGAAGASLSTIMSANVGAMMPLSLIITELAVGVPLAMREFDKMRQAQAEAAAAAQTAAEMEAKLNEVLAFGADAYYGAAEAASKLIEITDQSTAAIEREKAALQSRNEVLDADAAAYKARRDREDAAKIRNGADPETVRIERANADEAEALRKIDREQELKRAGLTTARNAAIQAEGQLGIARVSPDATPEKIAAMEAEVKKLRERAEAMEAPLAKSERIADARRTEIRERTAGTIEEQAYQRRTRLEREAKAAAEKKAREDARAARTQQGSALETAEEGLDSSARAGGLRLRKQGLASGDKTLQTVGKALSDGTDEQELQKLGDMVREAQAKNRSSTNSVILAVIQGLNEQAREIAEMKAQIRKNPSR